LADLWRSDRYRLSRQLAHLRFLCTTTANSANITSRFFYTLTELTIWCCGCDSELLTRSGIEEQAFLPVPEDENH
jgi:hypothetical protein